MSTTTRLTITHLDAGQESKEITINDAFNTIDGAVYKDMGEYTLVGLPAASANANAYALVTDAVGGRTIVRSNGTNWMIVAVEGAIVS